MCTLTGVSLNIDLETSFRMCDRWLAFDRDPVNSGFIASDCHLCGAIKLSRINIDSVQVYKDHRQEPQYIQPVLG